MQFKFQILLFATLFTAFFACQSDVNVDKAVIQKMEASSAQAPQLLQPKIDSLAAAVKQVTEKYQVLPGAGASMAAAATSISAPGAGQPSDESMMVSACVDRLPKLQELIKENLAAQVKLMQDYRHGLVSKEDAEKRQTELENEVKQLSDAISNTQKVLETNAAKLPPATGTPTQQTIEQMKADQILKEKTDSNN